MTATDKSGIVLARLAVAVALVTFVALAALGALIGALAYAMTQQPQFIAIWPGAGMAVGIAMMDRTDGAARRYWAWTSIVAGSMAVLAIALT